ncbi:unnamed protein product [Lymnaea stagnalis]|uniref:Medium-chain acyl-CoA ligase ACSF2, mitochondrial n=1 Tax=Lymnaea stagnalis TaxID=6523 RepID=A0AAV2I5Z2_LYMST
MPKDAPDTINKQLKFLATQAPHKNGFIFIGSSKETFPLSRNQLWDLGGRFASRLRCHGIQKADIICNTIPNSRTRLITDLGIIMAGAVTLNGELAFKDGQDLFTRLNNTKCQTIITVTSDAIHSLLRPYLVREDVKSGTGQGKFYRVNCERVPSLQLLVAQYADSHEDHTAFLCGLDKEDFFDAQVQPDDEAHIFITSGSTGTSKLVPRTHREVLAIAENFGSLLSPSDIMFNERDLGWLGGFPHAYYSQGVVTVVKERLRGKQPRSVRSIFNFLIDYGVTVASLMTSEIIELKKGFDNGEIDRKVPAVILGGQPITKNVHEILSRVADKGHILYGSTEAGFIVTGNVTPDNKDRLKAFFVGKLFAKGVEMRLVEEMTGASVTSSNVTGKIILRGGTVLRKYLNQESSTTGVFTSDGWYDTGDIGYIDEFGDIHVIGRNSDSVMNGPEIIYPQWMENDIGKCPGVESVIIVGIPHPDIAQEICACVVRSKNSNLSEEDLIAFCETLYVKAIPAERFKAFKILFLDSFPLNANGKIMRRELRDLAIDYFSNQ